MFTWIYDIYRPWFVAAGAFMGLTGCLADFDLLAAGNGAKRAVARDVMRTVSLYDGEVVVRGPDGYCIDRKSMRKSKSNGFVLLASCESLSGVRGHEVEPVIMTLAVLPGQTSVGTPTAAEIARSMTPVPVVKRMDFDDLSLVQFATGGENALPNGDPRHWRGAMVLNGHLIGLALYARKGSAVAGNDGSEMLVELARKTRASSPTLNRSLVLEP